jgi:hypothetical protein
MKALLPILFLLLTTWSFGQVQELPNGSFEDWKKRDHFKPSSYFSPTRNVLRTEDAKTGKYALKLVNTYIENSRGTRSYIRNIDANSSLRGFGFQDDPLSLVFWSKHDLAEHDTARIYVRFNYQGDYKGAVDFRFTGSTNDEWVKYSVPINWSGARTPDTVLMYFYSYADYGVDGDGWVIFDDVHFEKIGKRMQDLPNFDFEDWYNVGVDYPDEWRSVDLLVYDTYYSFLYEQAIFKVEGEEAYNGGASLLIKNYDNYGTPRVGYCYYGTENNDYYTPAFPVNDTFKYLQGYYKYLPDGDAQKDTARILFRTWEKGSSKSYDNLYLTESKDWKFFSMPINYYNESARPDSGAFIAYSTSTDSIHGFNSRLYLDELKLVMEPQPANIKPLNPLVAVYPNPVGQTLFVETKEAGSLTIINSLGQRVQNTPIIEGKNQVHFQPSAPGIYHLTLSTSKNIWTKKILKK